MLRRSILPVELRSLTEALVESTRDVRGNYGGCLQGMGGTPEEVTGILEEMLNRFGMSLE